MKEILKKENLKLRRKVKKEKLREKGITLIALVVTIIILLILTGVTLNMALSDNGLFKKAKEAVDKYEKAQEDEEEAIRQIATEMYNEYVGAIVKGYTPNVGTCSVTAEQSGYTEEQSFKTDENMQWRVWDFDGTILRLISDNPTIQTLKLEGATGYNHGISVMNKVCSELYSNGESGVTVTNLRRSDIQKVCTYDYTEFKHNNDNKESYWKEVKESSDGSLIHYGEIVPIKAGTYVPAMWSKHDSLWTYGYDKEKNEGTGENASGAILWEEQFEDIGEVELVEAKEGETFRESYYCHYYDFKEFKNERHYGLIFDCDDDRKLGTATYFLARRTTIITPDSDAFGFDYVTYGGGGKTVSMVGMYNTLEGDEIFESKLRPIVSINLNQSGYNLIRVDEKSGAYYKLEKK